MTPKPILAAALILSLLTLSCGAGAPPEAAAPPLAAPVAQTSAVQPVAARQPARDMKAEAAKYIGYYNSIRLTPEQEAVKNAALTRIAAPCCSDNTMATCCCPCNMAKAVWGLSAHLIAEEGYDADRLEKAVRDWLAAANPNGFSGQACSYGGCARAFHQDGCGGMMEGAIL